MKPGSGILAKNGVASDASAPIPLESDLICLSHLRWDFVFQRPQHLMTRFARHRRVFFVEEPEFKKTAAPFMAISPRETGVTVVTPQIPEGTDGYAATEMKRSLMNDFLDDHEVTDYTLWYYTPMARTFTRHLSPARVIYDCMDELSHFKGAPRELLDLESELFERADLVFTGGHHLYEYKKDKHPNIHPFPSSIDFGHFSSARRWPTEPADQAMIPGPRLGFFGVLDERFDIELVREIAEKRPEWQIVLIGPVVKIDEATLPRAKNIHYLGMKTYAELPSYLAHWDVAIMPFAINDATKFISPTKTPEFLAAGKPVVSTPIRDVVRPYGEQKLVHIASTATEFVRAVEAALRESGDDWLWRVDGFLAQTSWERTWRQMASHECAIDTGSMDTDADVETLVAGAAIFGAAANVKAGVKNGVTSANVR